MWVLIALWFLNSGMTSQSTYFADERHCAQALSDMEDAMKRTPSVTFLFHCAEVSSPEKGERAETPHGKEPTYQKM